jgi:hypothetical protein
MEQNCFQYNEHYYKQTDGLAMGTPTSAILAETYLQRTEEKKIYPIRIKHHITGYSRMLTIFLSSTKKQNKYTTNHKLINLITTLNNTHYGE